jgi:hypothetical protein
MCINGRHPAAALEIIPSRLAVLTSKAAIAVSRPPTAPNVRDGVGYSLSRRMACEFRRGGRRAEIGHKPSFTCVVGRTFRRRHHPVTGHPLDDRRSWDQRNGCENPPTPALLSKEGAPLRRAAVAFHRSACENPPAPHIVITLQISVFSRNYA